ncbi:hypothetical protein V6N13_083152 [Hibiscus sabdariffa]
MEGLNPAVTIPKFEAEHFELKPIMFNILNTLGQFGRSPTENARQHLKSFLEICNSLKIHGVSNDVLKLKLFPYSLRDKAKEWLNNIPPGSFQSWTKLCRRFLAKFSYNNMTDNLRNQITSFRQEDDEAMHEAWECYRDLFRRCPIVWAGPRIQLLRQRIQKKRYVKYIQPNVEDAPKLLVAELEQHPQSTTINSARISEPTKSIEFKTYKWIPSDNEVAKGATHEQCKAISTRSGKVLEPQSKSKQGEVTVANSKVTSDTDIPAQEDISASADEDHTHTSELEEAENLVVTLHIKLPKTDKL